MPGRAPERFRESLATTYDNHAGQRDEQGEADWRWSLAEAFLARLSPGDRLLEVGAGTGYTSRWFAARGLEVIATDLSPAQVEHCREKGLEAHVRDMYELGFPAGAFEAVWAMNCLLHVPNADLTDVLTGIRDVLVPGGLFQLGVWGGIGEEGVYEDDFYQPNRFFSFRTDNDLKQRVAEVFEILSFETLTPEEETDDGLHLQLILARKS
ncbi:MAG: methyltransferase domain-containing protein [Acidimicrobiia bacterium]|nr:methyltransferase domain-containing protein [Acidimicrobiia bacterium]